MVPTQIINLHLFNGQFLFILKFLFGVALVFLSGGILGNLLGLGNAENPEDAGGENHTNQSK